MSGLVLFDFDGTLADTAPDLAAAANRQRIRRELPPLPFERLRPVASKGARGLLHAALGMTPDDPGYEATRLQFLEDYAAASTANSPLFPGIPDLLNMLEAQGYAWGIVTNKATALAQPIIDHLGLTARCATIVCGDTAARAKPFPDPLLLAAQEAGYPPARAIYVGDDLRDIQAAQAAGMPVIAAAYGYLGADEDITLWKADAHAQQPQDLWDIIQRYLPAHGSSATPVRA